jgi:hypothetical protein
MDWEHTVHDGYGMYITTGVCRISGVGRQDQGRIRNESYSDWTDRIILVNKFGSLVWIGGD